MGHRTAIANPYASSMVDRDGANDKRFDNGEYRIDGTSVVGGDWIVLPAVCVFSGATEKLSPRTSILWRFSLLSWLPFIVALGILIVHAFSYGRRNGPDQSSPLYADSVPFLLRWIDTRSATALIFVAGFVGFFLQKKTRVVWHLEATESQTRRTYRALVVVAIVGLFVAGYFYRPVAGWIVFLLLFHVYYSSRRFPQLKLLERHRGFSRIVGFSERFFQAVEEAKAKSPNPNDNEPIRLLDGRPPNPAAPNPFSTTFATDEKTG